MKKFKWLETINEFYEQIIDIKILLITLCTIECSAANCSNKNYAKNATTIERYTLEMLK